MENKKAYLLPFNSYSDLATSCNQLIKMLKNQQKVNVKRLTDLEIPFMELKGVGLSLATSDIPKDISILKLLELSDENKQVWDDLGIVNNNL